VVKTYTKWYIYLEKIFFSPIMSKYLSGVPLIIKLHIFAKKKNLMHKCTKYARSEILKCLSVATKTETSGRIKINWIKNKIEMIGILKINSKQYVPRIYPFQYWYEFHNVRMILRTNYSAVISPYRPVCCTFLTENRLSDSGLGLGFVTCNLMIRQVILIKVVLIPFYSVNED
jgi:hypothetical protein